MARNPPKQLSLQQKAWFQRHVAAEVATWERVVGGLGVQGFDPRTPEYRRAWDIYTALKNTAACHRPRSLGLFSFAAVQATCSSGRLTREQMDWIGGAAMALIADLAPVVDFIDAGGFPCKLLAAAINDAVRRCEGIGVLLRSMDGPAMGGDRVLVTPKDVSMWLGDSI